MIGKWIFFNHFVLCHLRAFFGIFEQKKWPPYLIQAAIFSGIEIAGQSVQLQILFVFV